MRALIIDCGQAIRSMAAYALSAEGFEVMEAADVPGVRGLLARGFQPDLVVACRSERDNGPMCLRSLKAHHALKDVPVLLIADEEELHRQMEWKEAGVTCWITSPFTRDELLDMARMLMFERAGA